MASLIPVIKYRAFDGNGDPLVGGLLYTYVAGTSTPIATYSDPGVTPNTNPVVLDANGEADVWLADGVYKFVLKDADGVTQWTVDNVTISGSTDPLGTSGWAEHAVTDGQSATALSGETFVAADCSSVDYYFEIIRGTTVNANGTFSAQNQNGTWRIALGPYRGDFHGVTFSLTGTTTKELNAAADAGAGNGTIKISKRYIPA